MSGRRQSHGRWFSCKRVAPPTGPWCWSWCYYHCYYHCYSRYCCHYYYHCCYFQKSFQRSSHYFQKRNHCYYYHRQHLPRSHTVFDQCYCILWCSPRNTWLLRREPVAAVDDAVLVPSWSSLSCSGPTIVYSIGLVVVWTFFQCRRQLTSQLRKLGSLPSQSLPNTVFS
jgi:hypothetical protein